MNLDIDKLQLRDLKRITAIAVSFSLSEPASMPSSSTGGEPLPNKGDSLNGSNEVLHLRSSRLVKELQNSKAGRVLRDPSKFVTY